MKLLKYIPEVLKNFRELSEVFKVEESELLEVQGNFLEVLKDLFINDATERGLERWESILNIVPRLDEDLDDRRFKILTRLVKKLPYTYRRLDELLKGICGRDYVINKKFDQYEIEVKINITSKKQYDSVEQLLNAIVPANLVIDLKLIYNQHSLLAEYKHHTLGAYTHKELRENPFFLELDWPYNFYSWMEEKTYGTLENMTYQDIRGEEPPE
jgi:hypothetical protein